MIPKLHYISEGSSAKEQLENIQKACTSGIELVQLQFSASEKKFLKLANEIREITSHYQTRLIISDNLKIAKEVKADGVYFNKTTSFSANVRKQLHSWQIIGASANTIQDCEDLLDKQANYISLGPFRAFEENISKSLELSGFAAITDVLKTGTPIIGFGGIKTEDVEAILKTGINGIAVSEDISVNFNNIKVFNDLLNASSTAEQRYTFE